MPKILLNGDPINELEIDEIVRRATDSGHHPFEGGAYWDFTQNLNLLALFSTRKTIDIPVGMKNIKLDRTYRPYHTDEFSALRLGELLNWGLRHGIVRPFGQSRRWRLVHAERQFELCGSATRQRAVRVRGIDDPFDAAKAHTIWQRELKRRERARVKVAKAAVEEATGYITYIVSEAPATKLWGPLARFAFGQHDTLATCRELVLDGILRMEISECHEVLCQLMRLHTNLASRAADMDAIADVTDFL